MKWWGWGDEAVSFTHEDKPALGPFLERHLGIDVARAAEHRALLLRSAAASTHLLPELAAPTLQQIGILATLYPDHRGRHLVFDVHARLPPVERIGEQLRPVG